MAESSQPQQKSSDKGFLESLPSEVQDWQDRGIITPEQGREIISSYRVPREVVISRRRSGRLVSILAILGSVLIGLGVILFFAANWGEMPRLSRLAILLFTIAAAYGVGYWLKYPRGYPRVGDAVLLLAAVFYGAGIHLVAQVYNFSLNDPMLFLYWFLGVLPQAYLTRSQAVLFLAIGVFLGAVGFRLPDWLDGVRDGEAVLVFALYLNLGIMLYGLGKFKALFGLTRPYSRAYEVFGLLTILASVYMLGFRDFYDDFENGGTGVSGDVGTAYWILLYMAAAISAILFAATAFVQVRRRVPMLTTPFEAAAAAILVATAFLVIYVPVGGDVFYPVLLNGLLLVAIVGLVFAGYFQGQEALINIALIFSV